VGRGVGQIQQGILRLLLDRGGVLAAAGILRGLFDKVPGAGTKEYNVIRSSISRTLRGLRIRNLVDAYSISVAGHAALVVALTSEGAREAQEIVWEEE
jgi:hypothetical protein